MPKTVIAAEFSLNASGAEGSVKSLKAQLREAQAEVAKMSEQFGLTSDQAQNAARKAAQLKDAIGDAKTLTDAFNPDAKFKKFSAALQGVIGGFTALQGAQALFGSESEDLTKTLAKVQGAMAFSQGIDSVLEARESFKTLASDIKKNVITSFTSLRGALIATGIGALAVGVGLLVANFDAVKEAVLKFIPGLKSVGEFFGKLINRITDFVGVTSEATRAQEKFVKSTEKSLKKSQEFLDSQGYKYDEFTKRKIQADIDYKNKVLEINKDTTKSEKEKQDLIAEYYKKRNFEIRQADKDRLASQKKNNKEQITETKKTGDDEIKIEKETGNAKIENSKKVSITIRSILDGLKDLKAQDDKDELEREKALAEAKLELQLTTLDAIGAGVGILKMFSEKNKGLQKAALIAENAITIAKIILNTQSANAAVTAKYSLVPGGQAIAAAEILANKVKAGIGIATAIAATAKGLQGIGGGGGAGGGGNMPGGGGIGAPIGAQMGATALQQAQINAAGSAAVQAFVLESDVSGNQERIERLNRAARIQ